MAVIIVVVLVEALALPMYRAANEQSCKIRAPSGVNESVVTKH